MSAPCLAKPPARQIFFHENLTYCWKTMSQILWADRSAEWEIRKASAAIRSSGCCCTPFHDLFSRFFLIWSTVFAHFSRLVSLNFQSGRLSSNSCSAALICVFVLREAFAFLFQTFSRSGPPGQAPPTRGRYVFKKRKKYYTVTVLISQPQKYYFCSVLTT